MYEEHENIYIPICVHLVETQTPLLENQYMDSRNQQYWNYLYISDDIWKICNFVHFFISIYPSRKSTEELSLPIVDIDTIWTIKFLRCKPIYVNPPLASMVGLNWWVYTGQTCWSMHHHQIRTSYR